MTDDTQSRLDRIEQLLEDNAGRTRTLENFCIRAGQLIEQNAADISRVTDRIDRVTDRIDRVTDRIDRNAESIDRLVEVVAADRVRFAEHQRTTEAALAKIDRVLDYLMKQDATDD